LTKGKKAKHFDILRFKKLLFRLGLKDGPFMYCAEPIVQREFKSLKGFSIRQSSTDQSL